jgi:hypothetical protein
LQAVIFGTGAPGEWSPASAFDPNKNTIYFNFDEDMQFLFGIMSEYGDRPSTNGPVPGDPNFAIRISGEATEQPDDSKRYSRKGAIYYDENLQQTFERDTDTSGSRTDKKAKDTLRYHF